MNDTKMIKCENIHKSYGTLEVLRGVSLEVSQGEVVSVVGPSGAGKTTLLQIMGTLSPMDSGRLEIDGVDVSSMGNDRLSDFRNRHIGFVFQFHHLLPEFTALENVMMPALIGGASRGEAERHALELLRMMGLCEPPVDTVGGRTVGQSRLEEPRAGACPLLPSAGRAGADMRRGNA